MQTRRSRRGRNTAMGGTEAENAAEPLTQTGASSSTDPIATILEEETAIPESSNTEQNIGGVNPPPGQPNPPLSSPGQPQNPGNMGISGENMTRGDSRLMPIYTPRFAANWIATKSH